MKRSTPNKYIAANHAKARTRWQRDRERRMLARGLMPMEPHVFNYRPTEPPRHNWVGRRVRIVSLAAVRRIADDCPNRDLQRALDKDLDWALSQVWTVEEGRLPWHLLLRFERYVTGPVSLYDITLAD